MKCYVCDKAEFDWNDGNHWGTCPSCLAAQAEKDRRKGMTAAQVAYEEMFGVESAARQAEMAKEYHQCCGNHRSEGHHEACSKFVAPELEVHADQGSLL